MRKKKPFWDSLCKIGAWNCKLFLFKALVHVKEFSVSHDKSLLLKKHAESVNVLSSLTDAPKKFHTKENISEKYDFACWIIVSQISERYTGYPGDGNGKLEHFSYGKPSEHDLSSSTPGFRHLSFTSAIWLWMTVKRHNWRAEVTCGHYTASITAHLLCNNRPSLQNWRWLNLQSHVRVHLKTLNM